MYTTSNPELLIRREDCPKSADQQGNRERIFVVTELHEKTTDTAYS